MLHNGDWRQIWGADLSRLPATASLAGLADCGDEADKMASYK
jgi:hypothetical protein